MGYTRDENGLFMRGRLIEPLTAEHDAYGETLYLGKIEIMRLSGTADTLPITVPGRLMKGFRIGDTIEFNGELRSYNRHVDGANRLLLRPFGAAHRMLPGGLRPCEQRYAHRLHMPRDRVPHNALRAGDNGYAHRREPRL